MREKQVGWICGLRPRGTRIPPAGGGVGLLLRSPLPIFAALRAANGGFFSNRFPGFRARTTAYFCPAAKVGKNALKPAV